MIKKFSLEAIITENKPGELVNLNITKICKELQINFNPNHSFYVNNLNSHKSRGNHSNTNASEMILCLSGQFNIELYNGKESSKYTITVNEGIFIPQNIWIEINNFENCVILVYVDIDYTIKKESIYDLEEYKNKNI